MKCNNKDNVKREHLRKFIFAVIWAYAKMGKIITHIIIVNNFYEDEQKNIILTNGIWAHEFLVRRLYIEERKGGHCNPRVDKAIPR